MNDEVKKKLVEIMFPVLRESRVSCNEVNACEQCWFPCEVDRLADSLADALIAAGIGDVKEAEHRAELEERALKTLIKKRYTLCEVPTNLCDGIGCRSNECQKITLEYYLQQAEKELAEERK